MSERLLLRPEEVATALGCGRAKVYRLIATGVLPALRVGAVQRVPLDALKEWIAREVTRETAST
jgi:excisionase family DNA binding protein